MNAPTIPVTDKLNTGDGARRVCAMARDILGGNGILLDHRAQCLPMSATRNGDLRRARERSRPGRHCCRPARRPAEYIPA